MELTQFHQEIKGGIVEEQKTNHLKHHLFPLSKDEGIIK